MKKFFKAIGLMYLVMLGSMCAFVLILVSVFINIILGGLN